MMDFKVDLIDNLEEVKSITKQVDFFVKMADFHYKIKDLNSFFSFRSYIIAMLISFYHLNVLCTYSIDYICMLVMQGDLCFEKEMQS